VQANGTRGLRSVGYELTTTRYAGIDGETVNAIHALPNADDRPAGGVLRGRGVAAGEDPRPGARDAPEGRPGHAHGRQRARRRSGSLTCYCTGGMEGDEAIDVTLPGHWWKVALKFYAPDPWWYGDEQRRSMGLGAGANFFPIFPLVLAPSTVQGSSPSTCPTPTTAPTRCGRSPGPGRTWPDQPDDRPGDRGQRDPVRRAVDDHRHPAGVPVGAPRTTART
jgi:hypothetical protein